MNTIILNSCIDEVDDIFVLKSIFGHAKAISRAQKNIKDVPLEYQKYFPEFNVEDIPFDEIVKLYTEILVSKGRPRATTLNSTRKGKIKKIWNSKNTYLDSVTNETKIINRNNINWWKNYFSLVSISDFLMGRSTWKDGASFDFIITFSNMEKIVAGNYK